MLKRQYTKSVLSKFVRAQCGPATPYLVLTILGLLLVPATAQEAAEGTKLFVVHDTMPQFWAFWKDARNASTKEELSMWHTEYVQVNPVLFRDLESPCSKHFNESALAQSFLPGLPALIPRMREIEGSLPRTLADANAAFLGLFPDASGGFDLYLMASAGCFNGRSQEIAGKQSLLLGIDAIAEEGAAPVPLIEHELFHHYHFHYFPFAPQGAEPAWVRLWAEGLATYVSQRLNPSATAMDTMWMNEAQLAELNRRRPELSAGFLNHFDSITTGDANTYFLQDKPDDIHIPGHTGYYLGLRVAEDLGRSYSIEEMAHWNRVQAKEHVYSSLARMAKVTK